VTSLVSVTPPMNSVVIVGSSGAAISRRAAKWGWVGELRASVRACEMCEGQPLPECLRIIFSATGSWLP
jgi:hypothetical protein